MSDFEFGGRRLGSIHRKNNDKKFFCYFTGFLDGIVSSGDIEIGEVEPLIQQCLEFVRNVSENDAADIVEDFKADLLEHQSLKVICSVRDSEMDLHCPKSSMNRFLGFCAGIACDDIITFEESRALSEVIYSTPSLLGDPNVRALKLCVDDALADGAISSEESSEICKAITRIVGDCFADTGISALGGVPIFSEISVELAEDDLAGKTFVLTGNFSITPRRIIEEQLISLGMKKSKTVTKKVDYVIVASEASRDWLHTHKGTKIIRALELRDEFGLPKFVDEPQILPFVKA